jgi:hypothetical protein
MAERDWNHCQIVSESLAGKRAVDEQTLASLAVLGERLEELKEVRGAFSKVEFSPDVRRLKAQRSEVFVG